MRTVIPSRASAEQAGTKLDCPSTSTIQTPQDSSFRSGYAHWEIHRSGTGTRVIHHARMEPNIAIPPLLGTAVMKKTLRKEILESFKKLDCLARTECDGNIGHGETDDWGDSVYEF